MHRMAGAALCFWSALVLELGAVSFFTFWGLRWQLPQLHSLRDWADAYSWSDGCLDVWLQSVAHCALLAVHMLCMAGRMSKRVTALRSHKRARTFVWAVTSGCQARLPLPGSVTLVVRLSCVPRNSFGERAQVLLLAKAVAVAVAGREWLWPAREHPGAVGLVYLYSAVCASLAALFALRRAANALLVGARPTVLPLGLCV
jgi:hypothetical protein